MNPIATADPLGAAIPRTVQDGHTQPIHTRAQSRTVTIPPSTEAPRAHVNQMGGLPTTWHEVFDLAGRAAASGVRQWMQDSAAEPGSGRQPPTPRGGAIAVIAFVLSVIAIAGVLASVLAHQLGSASYEVQQAEANQAFREELAAQRESIAAQREAIYLLIDVLCVNDPRVCAVERKLQR